MGGSVWVVMKSIRASIIRRHFIVRVGFGDVGE